uniref:HAT C-terminal dimerisation domain-containing protein n=1 Tax=Latimeria chalumnae TaxID=7897 RepID=H3A901_LATCH
MKDYPWLVYLKELAGGFCVRCFLFAVNSSTKNCQFGVLVQQPFVNFKDAKGKDGVLPNHKKTDYHKNAITASSDFLQTYQDLSKRIDSTFQWSNQAIFDRNKQALSSLVKCVLFCGKQGISLRGHRDDATVDPTSNRGNFKALIDFRAASDLNLQEFRKHAPKNATYTSKTFQSDVIEVVGEYLQEKIASNINDSSPYCRIIADEVTDTVSNQEVLSLCLQYVRYDENEKPYIEEDSFAFNNLEHTNSETVAKTILDVIKKSGLDATKIRGQSYDTTASMSSILNGTQAKSHKVVPNAIYSPCNLHKLNLAIPSACKEDHIQQAVTVINQFFLFFDNSPKHSNNSSDLKRTKLISFCKTRWTEQEEAVENFCDMIERNNEDFCSLTEGWQWDGKTKLDAQGLHSSIQSLEMIVSIVALKNVLVPLRGITVKLQKRDIDVHSAYKQISSVIAVVASIREDIDNIFKDWYSDLSSLADELDVTLQIPRLAGQQKHRSNQTANGTEEYYKCAIVIPFVDYVLSELRMEDCNPIEGILSLIPEIVVKVSNIDEIVKKLKCYESDVPRFSSLKNEIFSWTRTWNQKNQLPTNLCKSLEACDKYLFPNLYVLFQIGCVLPVTSCESERSHSTYRRVKTYLRNAMSEERMTNLTLMHVHYDMNIDVDQVVDKFIRKHPHRLF